MNKTFGGDTSLQVDFHQNGFPLGLASSGPKNHLLLKKRGWRAERWGFSFDVGLFILFGRGGGGAVIVHCHAGEC